MNKSRLSDGASSNPLRAVIWGAAALALLTPWVAMQFTSEVNWKIGDFVVFGLMLLLVCGTYELATRLTGNKAYRLAVGIAVLGAFLLTWANLAVGIIGNEENPANLIFLAMPVVAMAGAFIVRFKAAGMVRVMVATAIVQGLTAFIALAMDGAYIFVLTCVFILVWLASAHLFKKAATEAAVPGPGARTD